jgi:hypothetical protein
VTAEPEFRSRPVLFDMDDMIALSRLIQPERMRMYRIGAGGIVALVALTVWLDHSIAPRVVDWPAMVLALFASVLLVLLSLPRVRAWGWLLAARRSPLYAAQSFALHPTALTVTSPKGKSEIPFTSFVEIKLAEGRMFFFLSKRLAYIVPRRAFERDGDFEAFVAAAGERWEKRHRL